MNFLLRTAQPAVRDRTADQTPLEPTLVVPKGSSSTTTLEGLIAEDSFTSEEDDVGGDGIDVIANASDADQVHACLKKESDRVHIVEGHSDVNGDEGWISIARAELPENWRDAPDINSFHSLDRSFVFPGEQIHVLACLSASKQDSEVITPFMVAAMMSENSIGAPDNEHFETLANKPDSTAERGEENTVHQSSASESTEQNSGTKLTAASSITQTVISASETHFRKENQKKRTEAQLEKLRNSHFFVRIAESDHQLWSKRAASETSSPPSDSEKLIPYEGAREGLSIDGHFTGFIDRGSMDASLFSGMARNTVQCCSLSNGDIVVLLQVNVGVSSLKDPVLEILQFEKYQDPNLISVNPKSVAYTNQKDPCRDLLKWLLPLERSLPPPARLVSPPSFSSSTSIRSSSHGSKISATSSSHLFSQFRSYSMSSIPQNSTPSLSVATSDQKPIFDVEDLDGLSTQKSLKSGKSQKGLLSFRGISLEPARFSVHCGLGGINTPGKRWRRKIEIIHPLQVHSFAAECNTEDLLCVQIKNISPDHTPDIIIYIDAISIVFEESSEDGPPLSLPVPCIEAGGSDHTLPDLSLRRGEEHSFILRPTTSIYNYPKVTRERNPKLSHGPDRTSSSHLPSKTGEGDRLTSRSGHYAVLVSYRCNYSESRLCFKHRTGWRPRIIKDLMISISSEMSEQILETTGGVSKLPVQVLTLQASNLTSEDLTLTVLAPTSLASASTVVSLYSVPSTLTGPFASFPELPGRSNGDSLSTRMQKRSSAPQVSDTPDENDDAGAKSVSLGKQAGSVSDVAPSTGLGSTHLWLQSMVPLGRVRSQSMAAVKLELLPLTDGIITLDTLQIHVKERGLTYIPQHCLKINATSSIATGIS